MYLSDLLTNKVRFHRLGLTATRVCGANDRDSTARAPCSSGITWQWCIPAAVSWHAPSPVVPRVQGTHAAVRGHRRQALGHEWQQSASHRLGA